jgi:hypothetical protein
VPVFPGCASYSPNIETVGFDRGCTGRWKLFNGPRALNVPVLQALLIAIYHPLSPLSTSRPATELKRSRHNSTTAHMTPSLSFFYSLKLIKPKEAVEHRRTEPPDCLWLPSVRKDAFTASEDGDWRQWSPGSVQAVPPNERSTIRLFSTVSLIWCPDRQAFLQVPFDCTKRNAAEVYNGIPVDWEGLSFHHQPDSEGRCISRLGYKYERNQLAACGSETWLPQLLPERYQCPERPEYSGSCHLAGELSILVGLAGLSTTPDWMHWAIRNCFHSGSLPTWKPHNKPREPGKSPTHTIRICDTDTPKQTTDADL